MAKKQEKQEKYDVEGIIVLDEKKKKDEFDLGNDSIDIDFDDDELDFDEMDFDDGE